MDKNFQNMINKIVKFADYNDIQIVAQFRKKDSYINIISEKYSAHPLLKKLANIIMNVRSEYYEK